MFYRTPRCSRRLDNPLFVHLPAGNYYQLKCVKLIVKTSNIVGYSALKMSNMSLVLIHQYIVYLRCCDDRRMMFSRNVFCGATNPRRPPGMIILESK